MVVPLILPVSGSIGAVPETKTRPAALTAWLYVGDGFAALDVKTIWRAIMYSFGTSTEMCELEPCLLQGQPRIGMSYLAGAPQNTARVIIMQFWVNSCCARRECVRQKASIPEDSCQMY